MSGAGKMFLRQTAFSGQIGAARFDITPPAGIYSRMWGAAKHDTAEGVHRPLTGTVVTFSDVNGANPLILVSLDLGWWRNSDDEWFVRGHVLESLGLETNQLIICLTHTHAGPSLSLSHSGRPGGVLIEPYLKQVRTSIVEAVKTALASSSSASLAWATGRCALAGNRHSHNPENGKPVVGYNPTSPADDTLLVGRVTTTSGQIVATIVNYACHPTTLGPANRLISPDFVGAMRDVVEKRTGGAPCMFLQGASGELAPPRQYTGDTALADQNGRVLGYAALSTFESMLPHNTDYHFSKVLESGASLAIWNYATFEPSQQLQNKELKVDLPLKHPELIALNAEQVDGEFDLRVLAERLERAKHLKRLVDDDNALTMPVWTWRLGDSFLVGVPAECYSDFQTKLRANHPHSPLAIVNIANGYYGYVPASSHYAQESYEVQVSLLEAGCLEKLTEATNQALTAPFMPKGVPAPHFVPKKSSHPAPRQSTVAER